MKKIVILFTFSLAISNLINAQLGDNFRFGFHASPVFSWANSNNKANESDGSNLGFKVGMMGEYFLGSEERFALKTGIDVAFKQGGVVKYTDLGGNHNLFPDSELSLASLDSLANGSSVRYKFQYVEVPVALKMRTDEIALGGRMRFIAEVPLFTLHFKTKARADINSIEDENVGKDTNLLNISWGLGGGVEYNVSQNTALTAGLFFQSGILDVTNDNNADDSKISIGSLTIRIGVLF